MNRILQGDALTVLRTLPPESVQMCVTSPPYFGLRDYGVDDQIGLETSPGAYITRLVEVFREVRRVLREDGTLWVNLGDSYSGSGKGFGGADHGKLGKHAHEFLPRPIPHYPLASKQLMMIPARVAIALQEDGYYLRSDIIWHKPNCMPEPVEDRPTSAHEHIFLLAKSSHYYYDADAIREPHADKPHTRGTDSIRGRDDLKKGKGSGLATFADGTIRPTFHNPLGRNKRNVWTVASQPYPESHFATFPQKLIEPCILAGSRPGDIVLDPFMGAGTTALVALQHGRKYLGIELNPEYIALAEKRIACVQPVLWEVSA